MRRARVSEAVIHFSTAGTCDRERAWQRCVRAVSSSDTMCVLSSNNPYMPYLHTMRPPPISRVEMSTSRHPREGYF